METTEAETIRDYPRSDLFFWPLAAALLVAGIGALLRLIGQRGVGGRASSRRVRVNSRTFDLEVDAP